MNINNSTNSLDQPILHDGVYEEPLSMKWIFRFVYVIVFLVGIIGNSVVCWTIIRRRRMRSSNYIFTFNLAFSDLVFVVFYVPSQMAAYENNHNWALGEAMCRIMYVILPSCLSASVGTLLAITGDRYRAVAHPMEPRITSYTMRCIIALIWLCSFMTALPVIIHSALITQNNGTEIFCDEIWPEQLYKNIYWISIFVIQYLLPLSIILVLAVLIAYHVEKNTKQLRKSMSKVFESTVRQRMKQTSKIIRMLVVLVLLYTICMLPQHVVFLWWQYGDLTTRPYRMYIFRFANVFPMANSAFNPIAYGTLNPDFKKAFKRFFTCDLSRFDSDESKTERPGTHRYGKFRISVYRQMSSEEPSVRGSFNKRDQQRTRSLPVDKRKANQMTRRNRTFTTLTTEPSNGDIKTSTKWDNIQSNENKSGKTAEVGKEKPSEDDNLKMNDKKLFYDEPVPLGKRFATAQECTSADHVLRPKHSCDVDSSDYNPLSLIEHNISVNKHIGFKACCKGRRENDISMGGDGAECTALIPSSDHSTDELLKPSNWKIGDFNMKESSLKRISSIQETQV